jgi:hypothetical protein
MKPHKAAPSCVQSCCLAVAVSGNIRAPAQTLTTIYSFTGANGDGEYPFPERHLAFDNHGAIY